MDDPSPAPGTRFVVDLGTLVLPPNRARALEAAIRAAVTEALGGLDLAVPPPLSEQVAEGSPGGSTMEGGAATTMAFGFPPGALYGLIFDPDALPDPPPVILDIDPNPF